MTFVDMTRQNGGQRLLLGRSLTTRGRLFLALVRTSQNILSLDRESTTEMEYMQNKYIQVVDRQSETTIESSRSFEFLEQVAVKTQFSWSCSILLLQELELSGPVTRLFISFHIFLTSSFTAHSSLTCTDNIKSRSPLRHCCLL